MRIKYIIFLMILTIIILLFITPLVFCIEPSSITTIEGTYNSGDLNSILTEYDNDYYDVSETTGIPAIDIRINFTDVITPFYFITVRGWHTGTEGHEVFLELWNYTSLSWDEYNRFYDGNRFWEEISLIPDCKCYVSDNILQARLYNDSSGNINHNFLLEYIYLNEEPIIGYDTMLIAILALVIAIFSFLFVIIIQKDKK